MLLLLSPSMLYLSICMLLDISIPRPKVYMRWNIITKSNLWQRNNHVEWFLTKETNKEYHWNYGCYKIFTKENEHVGEMGLNNMGVWANWNIGRILLFGCSLNLACILDKSINFVNKFNPIFYWPLESCLCFCVCAGMSVLSFMNTVCRSNVNVLFWILFQILSVKYITALKRMRAEH